jgi:hypothetical protein
MESHRKKHGTARGSAPKPPVEDDEEEETEEEKTSPGVDPELQEAMESLRRVQAATTQKVSDVTSLVRRTLPPPHPR